MRNALRVSRDMSSHGSLKESMDINAIEKDLDETLSDIIREGEFTGGELKRISGIFIKRIEDHRKELLSPVTGKDGKTILFYGYLCVC